jgi:hypothetical protein
MGSFGEYKLNGKSTEYYVLLVPVTLQGLNTELVYFGILKNQLKKRKGIILKNTSKKITHKNKK